MTLQNDYKQFIEEHTAEQIIFLLSKYARSWRGWDYWFESMHVDGKPDGVTKTLYEECHWVSYGGCTFYVSVETFLNASAGTHYRDDADIDLCTKQGVCRLRALNASGKRLLREYILHSVKAPPVYPGIRLSCIAVDGSVDSRGAAYTEPVYVWDNGLILVRESSERFILVAVRDTGPYEDGLIVLAKHIEHLQRVWESREEQLPIALTKVMLDQAILTEGFLPLMTPRRGTDCDDIHRLFRWAYKLDRIPHIIESLQPRKINYETVTRKNADQFVQDLQALDPDVIETTVHSESVYSADHQTYYGLSTQLGVLYKLRGSCVDSVLHCVIRMTVENEDGSEVVREVCVPVHAVDSKRFVKAVDDFLQASINK